MRAIHAEAAGDPAVLIARDLPDPEPGPGQLLVRVRYAGVNFVDVQRRRASVVGVPGVEGAGHVEALGPDVQGFEPGQRVAWMLAPGTYAELAAVDAARVVAVPDGVDLETAAAVLMQGVTAQYLSEVVPLERGDAVLVHAVAGGVGGLLAQHLRELGARVLGTVSSTAKAEQAELLGVEAIRYDQADFAVAARERTGGEGVAAVYDAIGKDTAAAGLHALRPRGTLVVYGSAGGDADPIAPGQLQQLGSLRLTGVRLAEHIGAPGQLQERAARLFADVAGGLLRVRIAATLPLADAAEAQRRLESRQSAGKLLLAVS